MTLLTVNFGTPWALTFHEANYAEPAREFLHTGDWLVPRIVGVPLWDKPPLMHWSIAASLAVFGTEAEWAARMPTVFSAVLTAAIVAAMAARWHGERVGLLAGLIQLTSVYVLLQARLAEADMMLCATVTGAMAALAIGTVDRPVGSRSPRLWSLIYFGAAGLSFLVKGPIGPALVAAGSGLFALIDWRKATWRFLLDPAGWAVLAVLVLAWPAAAMLKEPGLLEVWWRHNVARFNGNLEGGTQDPFFYLYTGPWLALPWTPIAVSGLVAGVRSKRAPRSFWTLLACWTGAGLILLSLSAWKHKHYIIPALPPLSIWAACGLARLCFSIQVPTERRPGRLTALGLSGLGFLIGLIGLLAGSRVAGAIGLVALLAGAGVAAAGTLLVAGRPREALIGVFAAIWMAFITLQSLAMPSFDLYRAQAELACRVSDRVPRGADLAVVEIPDPQVTYYLRLPLIRHDDWRGLADRLVLGTTDGADSEPIFVVGPQRLLPRLRLLGEVKVLDRARSHHPDKSETDRLMVASLQPDADRLAALSSSDARSSIASR